MHCTHECNVHKIFFLHSDLEFKNMSINCYFVRRNTYLVPYRILKVSYYWTIFWILITVRCFRAQPFQNKILCNNRNWKQLWLCIEIKNAFEKEKLYWSTIQQKTYFFDEKINDLSNFYFLGYLCNRYHMTSIKWQKMKTKTLYYYRITGDLFLLCHKNKIVPHIRICILTITKTQMARHLSCAKLWNQVTSSGHFGI